MQRGNRAKTVAEMVEWLTEHVRIDEDGCRIWAGSLASGGYPVVTWNHKKYLARRLLVELTGRAIPPRHTVYAACGKRLCMAEACLRIGSHNQALKASARKGKFMSGVRRSLATAIGRAPRARLGITEGETIARLRTKGCTWEAIGQRYGVTGSSAQKTFRNWQRVNGATIKVAA
jgi:hypothetical protein